MRNIAFILLSLSLFACQGKNEPEFSPEEKQNIEISLNLHNVDAAHKYKVAAIREKTNFKIDHLHLPEDSLEKRIRQHMEVFAFEYFNTKDISKDTALTFEKYLQYCKAKNADPKQAHKFLD